MIESPTKINIDNVLAIEWWEGFPMRIVSRSTGKDGSPIQIHINIISPRVLEAELYGEPYFETTHGIEVNDKELLVRFEHGCLRVAFDEVVVTTQSLVMET